MTLRIGVDATAWSNERGDGRFVRNAVARLVRGHPEADWVLYSDEGNARLIEDSVGAEAVPVHQRRAPSDGRDGGMPRPADDVVRLSMAVRRGSHDAFLAPSVLSYFPVVGAPSLVGLHDATATTHARLVLPARRDRVLWRIKQGMALRLAEILFTVSEDARAAISDSLKLQPDAIEVVPEGVDPAFGPQPKEVVRAALSGIGLAPDAAPFVFAAGISPHKGVDDLVEAYAAASRADPLPELVVAGSPSGPYVSAAGEVERRVQELGLGDRVVFPGFISDETLACLFTAATAAIVPSHSEGFGLSGLEAAACGAPLVLSDIGAHRETLGDAALFFDPGDRGALAERLRRLASDPEIADELRKRGQAAAARYSWDETARVLFALLEEVSRRSL
jgi:glycosyltransferase involved in cell wall biosynthesis